MQFIGAYRARSATLPTSHNYLLVTGPIHSEAISTPRGAYSPAAISGAWNYPNTQAFTVVPGTHLLLGRESARVGKVPCLGAQRRDIIQPSRGSNLWSLACKWRTLPLSYDASIFLRKAYARHSAQASPARAPKSVPPWAVCIMKPDRRRLTSSWRNVCSLVESFISKWSQPRLLGYTRVKMRSQCLKLNLIGKSLNVIGWFIIYVRT